MLIPSKVILILCVFTVQFAGSLGKLTVSSVNNPRKMIDAVVTTRTDDEVRSIASYTFILFCIEIFSFWSVYFTMDF